MYWSYDFMCMCYSREVTILSSLVGIGGFGGHAVKFGVAVEIMVLVCHVIS